ncbi:MAG TPA: tRNA-guanine transglycosylase DpdA [Allosphingosinicella sp.]|uniref:tRNA-guanine transglycosylase DpdA n=1 Tax=Allosphingosinicella sp. TaxID=2823234 RepID=UPI002EDA9AEE
MKFIFADSLDFVDPDFDFLSERNAAKRAIHRDDQFPHEFLDEVPYDGILVSRGIVGDALVNGKYTEAQLMRFRREGARKFLRYPEDRFPGSLVFGDCGAFTYRNRAEPPYGAEDTVEFYADGAFTHGCSPDHLIFDFDTAECERGRSAVSADVRARFDVTLQYAAEFREAARRLGQHFTPLGVVQGWSASSMAEAASSLVRMGYDYLALGGTAMLKIDQLERALAAVRDAIPANVRLHVLGFGKIEHLQVLERFGVSSFDTTSPLVRAFKDNKKNYWVRSAAGELDYYTAIRIPQAIENNRLKNRAMEGRLDQERVKQLEAAAMAAIRGLAARESALDAALDAVMNYWAELNWHDEECGVTHHRSIMRQRKIYERTLKDRPWEACPCRVCRESGVEAVIFRNSNRNKRRGMHNLHVFHEHLRNFRAERA